MCVFKLKKTKYQRIHSNSIKRLLSNFRIVSTLPKCAEQKASAFQVTEPLVASQIPRSDNDTRRAIFKQVLVLHIHHK